MLIIQLNGRKNVNENEKTDLYRRKEEETRRKCSKYLNLDQEKKYSADLLSTAYTVYNANNENKMLQ